MKKTYEAPKFDELGTFESMTHGASDGTVLDADYPITTPKPELTFS